MSLLRRSCFGAVLGVVLLALLASAGSSRTTESDDTARRRSLPVVEYRDRMRGGWLGQIIGVGWALPTEFDYPSRIIPEDEVPAWKPHRIDQHFNDDIFFNILALQRVDRLGPDASSREVALHLARTAGRRSRYWARSGIAPPDLAHPRYSSTGKWSFANLHMYSEFAGLISPGMPGRAADLIRRITMKSCATRYDGQFIAALNAEAFFEHDVHALMRAGLKVIPPDSQYAECIRDVVRWHRRYPRDWQETWHRIQEKYFENPDYFHGLDPGPGTGDAKIHGAYVVLGLLYGGGDLARSIVLTMRCGQDSDCSASNVGGILGVMHGADGIPGKFTRELDQTRPFNKTGWNLEQTFDACERVARKVVRQAGGRIESRPDGSEVWHPQDIDFVPEPYMKWWDPPDPEGSRFTDQEMRSIPIVTLRWALPRYLPGWEAENCHWSCGFEWERNGRQGVVVLNPQDDGRPVILRFTGTVPEGGAACLPLAVGGRRPWRLEVRVDGQVVATHEIAAKRPVFWNSVPLKLARWAGEEVEIELGAGTGVHAKEGSPQMYLAGLTRAFGEGGGHLLAPD